ncbi:MAG: hypothetical protein IAC23_02380 [Bacteroidetes bacterium]|uniref:Cell division protein FtsL n=1 Tax=Candidatus Cryptobacteroides merdavium TaxID=2840769 RepID=A0A9D9HC68_9BACT|nr:hypothetical protein [Candidatus Cryptobacteroides merdavium]
MKDEGDMMQETRPAEEQKKGHGKSLKKTAEFIRNSTIAVLRGEFLIRMRFDRYFLHIIYLFFLAVMSIWGKLEIEETMARMEDNKKVLEDCKIYHAQKTYELVRLDRFSTVQDMLEKSGSRLAVPDRPADRIK